ncbi:hypothetical protein FAGKG844_220039 [Frankia sp. AgKG'84/4]
MAPSPSCPQERRLKAHSTQHSDMRYIADRYERLVELGRFIANEIAHPSSTGVECVTLPEMALPA